MLNYGNYLPKVNGIQNEIYDSQAIPDFVGIYQGRESDAAQISSSARSKPSDAPDL